VSTKEKIFAAIFGLLLVVVAVRLVGKMRDPRMAAVESALATLMARHHVPGVAVGVIDRHQVAWAKAYGLRNAGSVDPVTDKTLFPVGGLGRALRAYGERALAEQGKAPALASDTAADFSVTMRSVVLGPLGMKNSVFSVHAPPAGAKDFALPHDERGVVFSLPGGEAPGAPAPHAQDWLWTNPPELANFLLDLLAAHVGEKGALVSRLQATGPYFRTAGGHDGYHAVLVARLATGQGAIVVTNGRGGDALISELLGAVARAYEWTDYETAQAQ
jgi:CubicO group peptidase (beta-lactamase class C family)